jgi:hypothetical protein
MTLLVDTLLVHSTDRPNEQPAMPQKQSTPTGESQTGLSEKLLPPFSTYILFMVHVFPGSPPSGFEGSLGRVHKGFPMLAVAYDDQNDEVVATIGSFQIITFQA